MPSIKRQENIAGDKDSRVSSGSSGEESKSGNGPNSSGSVGNGAEAQSSDDMMTRTSSDDSRTAKRGAKRNNRGRIPLSDSKGSFSLFESSGVISTSTNNIPESSTTAMRRRSPGHNRATSTQAEAGQVQKLSQPN